MAPFLLVKAVLAFFSKLTQRRAEVLRKSGGSAPLLWLCVVFKGIIVHPLIFHAVWVYVILRVGRIS